MAYTPGPGGGTGTGRGDGPPIIDTSGGGIPTAPPDPAAVGAATYTFIAGWTLLILVLIMISKTRIGYVVIYYSLLLMILLILVSEYAQIAPLLNPPTIGELEAQS